MRLRWVWWLGLLAMPAAACGSSSKGGGSTFTPATPVADPCTLLALPDVQALVPGAPDGAALPPEDDPDIWARSCAWQSGGKALTLLVEGALNSKGQVVLNSAVEPTSTSTRQATAVSGLGDNAVYLVNQGLGQILNALKGSTIISASASGFTPEVPESSLEPLVAEALGKL